MRANTHTNKETIRRSAITEANRSVDRGSSEHLILRLQRQVGNHAVVGLLRQSGAAMVVQRLSFFNTDWTRATRARRSGSGQTGVLFVEDDTPNALVVKRGSEPVRETELAHTMHEKLGRGKVKVPAIRAATTADRDGVRWVIWSVLVPTLAQEERDPDSFRAEVAKQFEEASTVFIMGKATGQEFGQLTKESPAVAHGLLTSPEYVKRLGMATAIDLFLGNRDRLLSANLGNWMTSISNIEEMITLIDNYDRYGPQKLTEENQREWEQMVFKEYLLLDKLETTANEVLDSLIRVLRYDSPTIQLTDEQREAFRVNFVLGMREGRARILSKLAPRIGRRSRTLKRVTVQGEGGQQAWELLKKRARLLRENRSLS
jgi:hypothetical protein